MAIVEIKGLEKTYDGGFQALKGVDLEIQEGEILALLGPNGAGKTTLISTICGITQATGGTIRVGGHDHAAAFREARSLIGLVPQEIALPPFSRVIDELRFSRGLYGCAPDDAYLYGLLEQLSLDDKAEQMTMALSGGMKRRVHIAKALAHRPSVIFLDEPTAGVDVELRKGMWQVVEALREQGVTIILTTHYIEEAESMADRIAVINDGRILLVEPTSELLSRLGRKELHLYLGAPIEALPAALGDWDLTLSDTGDTVIYTYDSNQERSGITRLLADLSAAGVPLRDLETRQSSLEEIFVQLVKEPQP